MPETKTESTGSQQGEEPHCKEEGREERTTEPARPRADTVETEPPKSLVRPCSNGVEGGAEEPKAKPEGESEGGSASEQCKSLSAVIREGQLDQFIADNYSAILRVAGILSKQFRGLFEPGEVVSEIYLRMSRHPEKVPLEAFAPWLMRVAVNLARSLWRRERTRQRGLATLQQQPLPQGQGQLPLDIDALSKHLEGCMTPEQLEVFILFEIEGLSLEAIASALGIPISTVTSRRAHGRRKARRLRDELDLGGPQPAIRVRKVGAEAPSASPSKKLLPSAAGTPEQCDESAEAPQTAAQGPCRAGRVE